MPSFYFVASRQARVRVRVNDGFNETVAVSAAFTAVGTPPVVTIQTPGSRTRVAGDARLVLSGAAFDQLLNALGGRSLRWFDGPFPLGTGTALTASSAAPATLRIRRATFQLRTKATTIRLRIKPGRTSLLLELIATINGNSTPFAAAVSR